MLNLPSCLVPLTNRGTRNQSAFLCAPPPPVPFPLSISPHWMGLRFLTGSLEKLYSLGLLWGLNGLMRHNPCEQSLPPGRDPGSDSPSVTYAERSLVPSHGPLVWSVLVRAACPRDLTMSLRYFILFPI